jgi:hypothetical protein
MSVNVGVIDGGTWPGPTFPHPGVTRWPTARRVPSGHNNRMEPDEIIITALAVIAAVVAIGAAAAMVIHLI